MFDWIELPQLDPRLVSLDTGGKVSIESFPEAIVVRSLASSEDILTNATGEINFICNSPQVYFTQTGNVVYFSSNFVQSTIDFIWSGVSYLHELLTLISESGFTVEVIGTDIQFSPNALHKINNKAGELTFLNKGNLLLRTNIPQQSITISPLKFDASNMDAESTLSSFEVHSLEGIYLEPSNFPDLQNLTLATGARTLLQGLVGVQLESPTGTQVTVTQSLTFGTGTIKNVQGQIQANTSMSVPTGTQLLGFNFEPRLVVSFTGLQALGSGIYQQTYSHNLNRPILWANVSLAGNQAGMFNAFEKVLSYEEKLLYESLLPGYRAQLETEFTYLFTNPANFTGSTYTTYTSLISDLMSDELDLQPASSGFTSLKNATTGTASYVTLLNTIQTSYPSVQSSLGTMTSTKLNVYTATDILQRPQAVAYYYDFTPNDFRIWVKSPTFDPPLLTAQILFST